MNQPDLLIPPPEPPRCKRCAGVLRMDLTDRPLPCLGCDYCTACGFIDWACECRGHTAQANAEASRRERRNADPQPA